jgi:hypothetical protein
MSDDTVSLQIAAALRPFWLVGWHLSPGRKVIRQLLASPNVSRETIHWARATLSLADLVRSQGDGVLARSL